MFIMQEVYVAKRIKEDLEGNLRIDSDDVSRIENEFRHELAKYQTKEENFVIFLDRLGEFINRSLRAEDRNPVAAYRVKFGKIAAEFGDIDFLGLISKYWGKHSFEILRDAKVKASTIYLDEIAKRFLKGMEDWLEGT